MSEQNHDTPILARFTGARGKELIVESLKVQKTILGNTEAAEELAARGNLTFFQEGEFLAVEDHWSNDIIFILAGRARIEIAGSKVAERIAGQHVGEMALIEPAQPRSASVVAMETAVGLIVSEEDFTVVATRHPDMWRQLAKDIAERLRQRKKFVRPSNLVSKMFVACASESLPVAKAIKAHFAPKEVVVEIWTDSVFKPSLGTMESLESKLTSTDFTVAVFSADDKVESRGRESVAPRDNAIFELGLFAGELGRKRSFFAVPNGIDVKIPSDLAGITSVRYNIVGGCQDAVDIIEACEQIEERISTLGPR